MTKYEKKYQNNIGNRYYVIDLDVKNKFKLMVCFKVEADILS